MRQYPDTTSSRFSMHARGGVNDPPLEIIVPGDPEQYHVLNIIGWSFSERPWPIGRVCAYIRHMNDPGPWLLIFAFDITTSGTHIEEFMSHTGPFTDRGFCWRVVLEGNASRKELAVQLR